MKTSRCFRSQILRRARVSFPLLSILFLVIEAAGQPSVPRDSTWVTNGTVYAVAFSQGITYIGGDFTYVGPNTWHGAALSTTSGAPDLRFPRVNGPIYVATPDGSGGWFIGGKFTKVGSFDRNGIARIKSDRTVDPNWNPNATGSIGDFPVYNPIYAIVPDGSTIYVGGNFSSIGGQQRRGVAALDASTGQATSWNPNASNTVRALSVSGSVVYVGGDFSSSFSNTIGGQRRNYVAAIDKATGTATSWNPDPNGTVNAIALIGTNVIIGGNFTQAGGQVRNYIAAIDASTGATASWNPNANARITTFAVSGSTLYVGGEFTTMGGLVRNKAAALSLSSSIPNSWNPNANATVRSLTVSGSTVYVGGDFTSIGGQFRNCVASVDASNGTATSWNSYALASVRALEVSGGILYTAGDFRSIGGQVRNRLAALDAATGAATNWNPDVNGTVWEVAPTASVVYVGGEFTQVGGQTRNRIAAIDRTTAGVTSWNPNANNSVFAILSSASTIYVGGSFSNIGGQTRNRLAAIDASTGSATSWNPSVSGSWVTALLRNQSTLYVGGSFTSVAGQSRQSLAAIDATSGTVSAWNPTLSSFSEVRSMALDASSLYIGGSFTQVKGQPRNRLAAVDITTADPTGWNPNANGSVLTLFLRGQNVYAGGNFTNVGGYSRKYLAALDKVTGIPTDWSPDSDGEFPNYGSCQFIVAEGETIFAGGTFTTVRGEIQDYFAQFGNIAASTPSTYVWPVTETHTMTQDYSQYNAVSNPPNKYHTGIDLVTTNRVVIATFPGTVHSIKNNIDGWGNAIMISHSVGIYSLYAHMASFAQTFSVGQPITAGQQIGTMGNTGNVTGLHLHFEVKPDGSWGPGYTDDVPDGYGYKDPRFYLSPYAESGTDTVVVRVTSTINLNVRSGPSTGYALLTQLTPNQRYVAYKSNTDWYKIYLPNANGSVSGWSIRTSALAEEPTSRHLRVINTSNLGLLVRTGAGTNFAQVTTKNGLVNLKVWDDQRFPIIDRTPVGSTTWYKIDLPTSASQSQGWISGDFVTGIENSEQALPEHFALHQNYPNPFNPSTTISFGLPSKSFVLLKVFDALGKEVSILASEELPAGTYSRQWNATGLASGVYFYRLQAGPFIETKKLILLR